MTTRRATQPTTGRMMRIAYDPRSFTTRGFTFLLLLWGLLAWSPAFAQTTPPPDWVKWPVGYVFVGVGGGQYNVYDNSGNLKGSLAIGANNDSTAGCAFDSQFNFYGTNTSQGQVKEFSGKYVANASNSGHPVVQTLSTSGLSPESLIFDAAGNLYVGGPAPQVLKFVPSLPPGTEDGVIAYPNAATQISTGGQNTDWIDLGTDQKTLFFSGNSAKISLTSLGSNSSSTAYSLSSTGYDVRLLAPYNIYPQNSFPTGGMLIAQGTSVLRLQTTLVNGTPTLSAAQTYTAPKMKNLSFLALDPGGTAFWVVDTGGNGSLLKIDFASGSVLVNISLGLKNGSGGVCVMGGHQLNIIPMVFKPGTKVAQNAPFGNPMIDANGSVPVDFLNRPLSKNYHYFTAIFDRVLQKFVMVVSATEGIDNARFSEYFSAQAGTSLKAIPYTEQVAADNSTPTPGRPVVYRVENPPVPGTDYSVAGSDQILIGATYSLPCSGPGCYYTPPACLSMYSPPTNPRMMRDPSSCPPTDAADNHQFAFDFTAFVDTAFGGTKATNDFLVADRCPAGSGATVTFNNPLPTTTVKSGSVLPIKLSVVDQNGNTVTNAVAFPNDISLAVVNIPTNQLLETFSTPGSGTFSFFTLNGQSYAGNLDTTGLPLGLTNLCVTSVSKATTDQSCPAGPTFTVGTGTDPGLFAPICTQVTIIP